MQLNSDQEIDKHSRCRQTYLGMQAGLEKSTFFSEINEDKEIQPTHTEKEHGKMMSDWDNMKSNPDFYSKVEILQYSIKKKPQ